ncbi:hypothetical protein CCO03_07920 [Comamonas serinivorans]|uniref:Glycerate kinase n=1 Tax=Comamonas serinivorans TaxID=1082851 RepID=A0A1Y0EMI6_9BURK|nr:DUF4147 domain-containing protein [Comamonas serinivorans]ARU04608.1 hypothetical protein CCO03_07920 [Comamonas serinivorans]
MPADSPRQPTGLAERDAIARALLRDCFNAAVAAAQPARVLAAHLPPPPVGRTVVVGAGKAAGAMAQALEAAWPVDAPLSGCVVTRDGHTPPRPAGLPTPRIEVLEAAHPVPDARSAAAGRRMLELVRGTGPDDLVIALISGGGSALLMTPVPGLDVPALQAMVQALLTSGLPISAMNTVRKHVSLAHGGRLALASGAPVYSLLISDVPGDAPAVIASGPTVADPSTCAQALAVLDAQGHVLPAGVRQALLRGELETPKPCDWPALRPHDRVQLIATPWQSLQAAARLARERGWPVQVLGDALEGEARVLGALQADLALAVLQGRSTLAGQALGVAASAEWPADRPQPCLILSGGEATVRVSRDVPRAQPAVGAAQPSVAQPDVARPAQPDGAHAGAALREVAPMDGARHPPLGGRAGEFCLGVIDRLQHIAAIQDADGGPLPVWALAADTDGIDGSSPSAGAVVTPDSLARAAAVGASLSQALADHDSHGFFGQLGDLVTPGPTHTNVNDFRALLVWP